MARLRGWNRAWGTRRRALTGVDVRKHRHAAGSAQQPREKVSEYRVTVGHVGATLGEGTQHAPERKKADVDRLVRLHLTEGLACVS